MKPFRLITQIAGIIFLAIIMLSSCKKDNDNNSNNNNNNNNNPTTKVLTLQPGAAEGKDAMIWNSGPNWNNYQTNYGGDERLLVQSWTNTGIPDTIRSLIKFDLSSIPSNASIEYAKLSLFHNPDVPDGHSGNTTFFIQRIITSWEENVVTWVTQPQTTTNNQVSVPQAPDATYDFIDMDVTNLVKDMIAQPQNSYGFMIRFQIEEPHKRLDLASSDHSAAYSHPKLEVKYTIPK